MVAIVSGTSVGLNSGSAAIGTAAIGNAGEGVYVDISSGNLVLQDLDGFLAGLGADIASLRTYNSQGVTNFSNNDGWLQGGYKAITDYGTYLTRTDSDGSVVNYVLNSTTQVYVATTSTGGALDTIARIGGTLTWTDGNTGATETYQTKPVGTPCLMVSSTDIDGNKSTYTYNTSNLLTSVIDASGDRINYTYSGTNLTSITTILKSGKTLNQMTYIYDSTNRLIAATVNLNPTGTGTAGLYTSYYTYDGASNRVTSIRQTDGTTMHFTYAVTGSVYKLATYTDGDGNITKFAYNTTTLQTTVTDPLGESSIYQYSSTGTLVKVVKGVTAANASGLSQLNYTYNTLGEVTSVSDGGSYSMHYTYDANGNLLTQVDATGDTRVMTYNSKNQVLTSTVYATPASGSTAAQQPQTTSYVYDAGNKNLLRFKISPEGRVTEYLYNTLGLLVSTIDFPATPDTTDVQTASATLTEAIMLQWVATQDLSKTQRTDLVYDYRGQLQSRTIYGAADASGNGLASTASTTQYVYDQRGELLQTISPDTNQQTLIVYDGLGRVLSTVSQSADGTLSNTTLTQYDDVNNKVTVTLANGLSTTSVYDHAGRLLTVTKNNGSTSLGTTTYSYDTDGHLLMTQDPTGLRTWMLYDAQGREVATVDATGTLTEYKYNASNLVTETIVYATKVNTALLVDASGVPTTSYNGNPSATPTGTTAVTLASIRPASNALDSKAWTIYDADNRPQWQVDALGYVTQTQYDGASRILSVTRLANAIDTSQLGDGTSVTANLGSATSTADRTVSNVYDKDGLLRATIDAEGYLTEYRYNAAGEEVETIAYATKISGFTTAASIASALATARSTDSLSGLLPASSSGDIASYSYYNGKQQLVAKVDGEGYLTEFVYDANGNLTQSIRYATHALTPVTVSSTLSSLRPASSAQDQVQLLSWDGLNRLSTTTNAEGSVTAYSYDSVGNVLATVTAKNTSDTRTLTTQYDVQGNITAQLSADGAALLTGSQTTAQVAAIWAQYATTYTYDAAGRRTSATDPNGNRTVFFYDDAGRLTDTVNALGDVTENTYDALGHLTATTKYGVALSSSVVAALQGGLLSASSNQSAVSALAAAKLAGASSNSVNSYTYNADGELIHSTDAGGGTTSISYDAFGDVVSTTTSISSTQSITDTSSYDRRGLKTGSVTDAGHLNVTNSAQYDAFGRLISSTDANGNVTQESYDRLGRVVQVLDPTHAARSVTYDAFGRVLTQTDALGNTTSYSYSNSNRSVSVTLADGVTLNTVHNREGQTQSVTDGDGNVTSYSYDADGNLLSTQTPLGTSSNQYDAADRLIQSTDAKGNVVVYTYDAANRVLTRTVDPSGLDLVTSYQYDAKGEQIRVTDPDGIVTQTTYDSKGEVLSQTVDPSGASLTTSYTYDLSGNVLSVTSPGGTVTDYVYDALGRRIQTVADATGLALSQSYAYDSNGNVISRTDADGNVTRYVYDADNRLVYTVNSLGDVSQNTYDADGNIVTVTAYATAINTASLGSSPTVATVAALITVNSAADNVVRRSYDSVGRLSYSIDAVGDVTGFSYDGNGNVTAMTRYANPVNVSTLTAGSAPTVVADSTRDTTVRTVYDALNRAIYTLTSTGDGTRAAVTATSYDLDGNVTGRISYAATIPATTAATQAAVAAAVSSVANSATDISTHAVYDAANRLIWSIDSLGAVTGYHYDKDGNLLSEVHYATRINLSTWVAGTAPAVVASASQDEVVQMVYDSLGRVIYTLTSSGDGSQVAVTAQTYDRNGNVISRTNYGTTIAASTAATQTAIAAALASIANPAKDQTSHAVYDSANRLSWSIDGAGDVISYSYDSNGNLLSRTSYANRVNVASLVAGAAPAVVADSAHDEVVRYVYDALNRNTYTLSSTADGTRVAVTAQVYDAKGNLITSIAYAGTIAASTTASAAAVAAAVAGIANSATDHSTSAVYDAANRQTWTVDGLGDVRQQVYDQNGNVVKVIQYANRVAANATPSSVVASSSDRVTLMTYDSAGRLTYRIDALGDVTQIVYDANGNVVKQIAYATPVSAPTDATSAPTTAAVAASVTVNASADRSSYAVFDSDSHQIYSVDANGTVSQNVYDSFGNVIATTVYATQITTASLPAVLSASDIQSHLTVLATADRTSLSAYDDANRLVYSVDPLGYVVKRNYDALGRNTGTTLYAAAVSGIVSGAGSASIAAALTANAAADRSYSYSYDAAGNLVSSTDALGASESYTYNGVGDKLSFTNQLGNTWNYDYDAAGRMISETDPAVSVTLTALSTQTSSVRTITLLSYDALGNLIARTEAAGTAQQRITSYVYDALGRQVKVIYPPVAVYDSSDLANLNTDSALNAARTETTQTLSTQTSYDSFGDAVANIDVAGNISYKTYDALGRISYDVDAMGYVSHYQYDSFGDALTLTRYAAAVNLAALTSAASSSGTSAPSTTQVTAALVTGSADRTLTTQYDKLGRTTLVTQPASWVSQNGQSYLAAAQTRTTYNAFGQVIETSVLADLPSNTWANTYAYFDQRGQQIASVDALGYLTTQSYDAAGNVTGETDYATAVTPSVWAPGQATPASSGNDRITSNAYDQMNRLISRTQVNVQYSAATDGTRIRGNLVTTYGYDALGNQTRLTDALGNTTYTYYDALGRTKAIAAPAITVYTSGTAAAKVLTPLTVFLRDIYGNVTARTEYANGAASATVTSYGAGVASAQDRTTLTAYDIRGDAIQTVDADGVNRYMSYDAQGNMAKSWQDVSDAYAGMRNVYTVFQYDKLGHQIAIITPATTAVMTGAGVVMESQQQAGSTTVGMVYDAFGEVIARGDYATGSTAQYQEYFNYDNTGKVWRTNSGSGTITVTLYNLQGQTTAQISSAGSVGSTTNMGVDLSQYSSAQAVDQLGNSGVRRLDIRNDLLGRAIQQTLALRQDSTDAQGYRPVVNQTFDRWGNVLSESDVRSTNWITYFQYSADNKVIQVTQPDGNGVTSSNSPVTQVYYDAIGQQIAMRDADGNLNGQTWNAAGKMVSEIHADGGVITHGYDIFGDQVKLTDAMGNVTRYSYDNLGHNTSITNVGVGVYTNSGGNVSGSTQNLTVTMTYDQLGRKITQTDGTGAVTRYAYDARNQVISITQPLGEVSYLTYDAQGKEIGSEDTNGKVSTWTYDYFGQLQSHTDIGGASYWFQYDNARQLIAQGNSRGVNQSDSYDAAGQLVQIVDHALGQTTNYAYNASGQHVLEQTIQGGVTYQNQTLAYDTLGRLAQVNAIDGVSTTTVYDKMGNKLYVHITYNTTSYQTVIDYGNVQTGTDESGAPIYTYEAIGSHIVGTTIGHTQDMWSAYDVMNRQILVDGAANGNAADLANVTSTQGHILAYDRNGNRISDTSWGTQVTPDYDVNYSTDESGNQVVTNTFTGYGVQTGVNTQWYGYDAMNRLSTVATGAYGRLETPVTVQTGVNEAGQPIYTTYATYSRIALGKDQAIVLDTRLYDGASRELQSGPRGSLPSAYISALVGSNTDLSGATSTTSAYDADGRLLSQHVVNEADGSGNYDMLYTAYDHAGNVISEQMTEGQIRTNYTFTEVLYDGYKEGSVSGVSTNTASGHQTSGVTTENYDVNGYLVSVTDSANGADNRSFVNDVNGHALLKNQQGNIFEQLVVNGDVVGKYGVSVNQASPKDSNGNPNYIGIYNFDLAYEPVSNSYPAAATGQYPVQSGDSLQSIALAAYGDSSLWYEIADANGLSGNSDLRVGQVLTIPTKLDATHNTSSTYAPYDASKVVGSTTPNLPTPAGVAQSGGGGGCGLLGEVIMIVVTIVVAVVAPELLPAMSGLEGAMVTAAVESIATQLIGDALGITSGFSWKQVGMAALTAGVTYGVGGGTQGLEAASDVGDVPSTDGIEGATSGAQAQASSSLSTWAVDGAKVALRSAVTQGIGVTLGLQKSFSWKGVIAAGVSSAVGEGVSAELSSPGAGMSNAFVNEGITRFASGLTQSLVYGGRINVASIAVDAFGNALGDSIRQQMAEGQQESQLQNQEDARDQAMSTAFGVASNGNAPTISMTLSADSSDGNTVDNWDSSVTGRGDDPASPTTTTTLTQEDVDPWSREAQGYGENANAPESQLSLLTVGKNGTLEALAKQQYGDQWRAGMALMAHDNGLKVNDAGSPIIQEGQSLKAGDLSVYSDETIAKLSQIGGNIEAANSQGLQARAALIAAQNQQNQQASAAPTTETADERAYRIYMAAGGRNSEVAGPAVIHVSAPQMPTYDYEGNPTGNYEDAPVGGDGGRRMTFDDVKNGLGQAADSIFGADGKGGILVKTVVGTKDLAMLAWDGLASGLHAGAEAVGLTDTPFVPAGTEYQQLSDNISRDGLGRTLIDMVPGVKMMQALSRGDNAAYISDLTTGGVTLALGAAGGRLVSDINVGSNAVREAATVENTVLRDTEMVGTVNEVGTEAADISGVNSATVSATRNASVMAADVGASGGISAAENFVGELRGSVGQAGLSAEVVSATTEAGAQRLGGIASEIEVGQVEKAVVGSDIGPAVVDSEPKVAGNLLDTKPVIKGVNSADLIARRVAQNALLRESPQFAIDMGNVGVTDAQIASMFAKEAPLGFESADQFQQFKIGLNNALSDAGLQDAEIGLKGTSTTFYSENPSKPLGHHWDADPLNPGDYDLNVTSPAMVQKLGAAGVLPSQKYNVFKTSDINNAFPALDAFQKNWSNILGRPVNFVGYPSSPMRDTTEYILRTGQ